MVEADILSQKLQLQLSHELSSTNEGTVQEQIEMHKKPCTILRSTKEGYEPSERKKESHLVLIHSQIHISLSFQSQQVNFQILNSLNLQFYC